MKQIQRVGKRYLKSRRERQSFVRLALGTSAKVATIQCVS